jgi:choline transport protein
MLLSIIYVFSSTAFNAIISLQAMALSVSYIPPILFSTLRRLRTNDMPAGPFNLGRGLGLANSICALVYLIFIVIWMPFPTVLPVTAKNFNYAGPLLGAVIIGALVDWMLGGHKRFKVPVAPQT